MNVTKRRHSRRSRIALDLTQSSTNTHRAMRYRFFFVAAFSQWLKMHGESRLYAHTLMFWWTQQQHHLSQTCNKSFIFILFNTCTTHKRQRHSIWEEKNTQKIFQPYASIRYASYLPRMLFPLYNLHHHRTSVCYHCTLIRVTFFFLPIWCCSQPMFLCSLLHSVQKSYIYIVSFWYCLFLSAATRKYSQWSQTLEEISMRHFDRN